MHSNANIAFQRQEARRLLDTILLIQPRVSGGAAAAAAGAGGAPASSDQIVGSLASEILAALPADLDLSEAAPGLFDHSQTGSIHDQAESSGAAAVEDGSQTVSEPGQMAAAGGGRLDSLSVVLGQELERFKKLADALRGSLRELQRAIKGQVVMSSELEAMYHSLLNNQVGGRGTSAAGGFYVMSLPLAPRAAYIPCAAGTPSLTFMSIPAAFVKAGPSSAKHGLVEPLGPSDRS